MEHPGCCEQPGCCVSRALQQVRKASAGQTQATSRPRGSVRSLAGSVGVASRSAFGALTVGAAASRTAGAELAHPFELTALVRRQDLVELRVDFLLEGFDLLLLLGREAELLA